MGGGDLNMKKSWHPLLLKNQERVWLEEKKALEEKKKLDQLRKEKEEERQLQELQRLQEEQTGKKRTEKLEWMYTTPATGSTQNPNDLEDYLLGKKRVDKILTADENAKVGAAHKNFIAVQNANTARDIAAKIREDPLLAIKQQEQAAYQELMSNPLRLREMQERNGIKPKKDKKERKKEKEEKKRLRLERKRDKYSRSASPTDRRVDRRHSPSYDRYSTSRRSRSPRTHRRRSASRSLSPPPSRSYHDSHRPHEGHSSRTRQRSRSRSPGRSYRSAHDNHGHDRVKAEEHPVVMWPRSDESDDSKPALRRGRSRSLDRHPDYENGKRRRSRSRSEYQDPYSKRSRITPPPPRVSHPAVLKSTAERAADDRAARLAAMSANASSMTVERQERLAAMLVKEKAELEAEERVRMKSKGMGGFLSNEQKKVFGGGEGGLEDRIRRGRGGMVVDAD